MQSSDATTSAERKHIPRQNRKVHPLKSPSGRRGAMLVLICIMMFAFVSIVAFSVDIAYMNLVKTELRTATDAASKAASENLARTQNIASATARGIAIANENLVANRRLQLTSADFEFGRSDLRPSGAFVFQKNATPINSVRVTGQRTAGSLSGSVGLFFGRAMGVPAFEPVETCTSTYIQRDIVLVLDRSGSMIGQRARDLINAVHIFVDIMKDSPVEERIGLASYSTSSSEDVALTTNLDLITSKVDRMVFSGLTNISGGIDSGRRIIANGRSPLFVEKTMIVMTDGGENAGRNSRLAAADAFAEGTTLHTITFGVGADVNRMRQVANIGRGRHYHASNPNELRLVFREIALTLTTIITE
jgi:Ca-activated chloride channel family protein